MSNHYQPFSSSLPPPPMESPPKPPRRVSTIMSPINFRAAEDTRPTMMKRLTRVLSTKRLSMGNADYDNDGIDPSASCHMDALLGKVGIIAKAITQNNAIVNQTFSFSTTSLLSPEDENNEFYIPPPPLPKLVRLTLKKPVAIMTLDQRWLLQHAFAESTLLHYACADDQHDVVKLLLEKGADWTLTNGSNKTAEMYTVDERIRELFNNAEDRYTPYFPPSKQPTPVASPITASPPSILKRANSSRRRQSIINDSSWADSNLRTTVHQAQLLNIRTTSTTTFSNPSSVPDSPASASNTPNLSATNSPLNSTPGKQTRRPTLAAKSRPEPKPESEDEKSTRPVASVAPTNYSDISRSLTRTTSAMGSMYSTAEVVTSLTQLELDTVSVASHNSNHSQQSLNTANTSTTNNNRKRLSFRRGSGIIQTLREKETVPPPPPVTRVPPPAPPPPPSDISVLTMTTIGEVRSPPVKVRKSVKKLSEEEASVGSAVQSVPSVLSARPLPVVPVHRVPPPPPSFNNNNNITTASIVEGNEESSAATSRKSVKSKRGSEVNTVTESKPVVRHPPPPPPPSGANTKTESSAADVSTITTATGTLYSKDNLRKSTKRTKADTAVHTPPPPPIRVMRRLSMNMSIGAVEAESYIEGANGEEILSTGLLGSNSPDKHISERKDLTKVPSPESKSTSVTDHATTTTNKKPLERNSHILRHFAAELSDDQHCEAWEKKAEDPSMMAIPLRVLQASMKSGVEDGLQLQDANRLIARAAQLEKAEAREAKNSQVKAERLQFMLSKLTPLENIASGVLLKGRSVEEVSQEFHEHEENTDVDPLAIQLFTATSAAQSKDDFIRDQSSAEKKHTTSNNEYYTARTHTASPSKEAFHSLKFRDMIWHRAAHHLNSAMSDKQRSHYDKARLEAYQLGVKLMKKEFSTMAYQEHWEAVDLVLEQRQQAADRDLKNSVRSFMLSNHDIPDPVPVTPQAQLQGQSIEQIGGRNSSFVPFSRISFAGLFNDNDSD